RCLPADAARTAGRDPRRRTARGPRGHLDGRGRRSRSSSRPPPEDARRLRRLRLPHADHARVREPPVSHVSPRAGGPARRLRRIDRTGRRQGPLAQARARAIRGAHRPGGARPLPAARSPALPRPRRLSAAGRRGESGPLPPRARSRCERAGGADVARRLARGLGLRRADVVARCRARPRGGPRAARAQRRRGSTARRPRRASLARRGGLQAVESIRALRCGLCTRPAPVLCPPTLGGGPRNGTPRGRDAHGDAGAGRHPSDRGHPRARPAIATRTAVVREGDGQRMSVDVHAVRREKDDMEARYGPWTAHNIRLAEGLYTISPEPAGDEVKLRRVTQLANDVFGGSFSGVRVLDLASLEGMYSLEFARRGARVVAIEGREANVEKARFAARTLGLEVDFQLGDVRDLSRDQHGEFDLVLALGILYHLDADDLFSLIDRIGTVTQRALVVDTGIGSAGTETFGDYRGARLVEHRADSTEEERRDAVWSSLDNLTAVALTRPSLERALARQGFT